MGPASFLTSDDATIASRNQMGLAAQNPEWLDVGRGLHREEIDNEGRRVSHLTDETTNRAFWKHYRTVMSA
jgi:fatty-acyl-CoA synthase